jgi:DNA-directed RNA polymerase I, II, and III subunit RPABC2
MIADEEDQYQDQEQDQDAEAVQDPDAEAIQDPDAEAVQEPELLLKSYKTQKNINPESVDGSEDESIDSSKSEDLEFISDSEDNELDEDGAVLTQNTQFVNRTISPPESEVESDNETDLQKIEEEQVLDYINRYHSECLVSNSDEIEALSKIIKVNNIITDANHKTNPILSKYEKTKILGQRTKQLNSGCLPYISVPSGIIDNYLIAQMELKEKKIPVIVRRPVSNTKSEYWKLEDLEQIY